MTYAVIYSSKTGNTRRLAEAVRDTLPDQGCLYFGPTDSEALAADRIYLGFWTDKGSCDPLTAQFLRTLTHQELFLFGTAGFGASPDYFDKVLRRTTRRLPRTVRLLGRFMCQGRMPMAVRQRYEWMLRSPIHPPRLRSMIRNFDQALSHPDQQDLDRLCQAVRDL